MKNEWKNASVSFVPAGRVILVTPAVLFKHLIELWLHVKTKRNDSWK